MTNLATPTATNLTYQVAHAAARYLTIRADAARQGADGQWANADQRAAFIDTINRTTVCVTGPGKITATTPAGRNGYIWSYVGSEALTRAANLHNLTDPVIGRTDDHVSLLIFTA
jgi:hypothetical protein